MTTLTPPRTDTAVDNNFGTDTANDGDVDGVPPRTPSTPVRSGRLSPWKRSSRAQRLVMALASIAPLTIIGTIGARLAVLITTESMMDVALAAGENPGMITFGAMFLASPVQWLTGRSQIRVRKFLGIVFFLLALSNGAMFMVERALLGDNVLGGLGAAVGEPFLIAATIAVALAAPLFATSGRWAQRAMGMRNWRLLHRATYPVGLALMAHVLLIGDIGPGFVMIGLGFLARIPAVRRRLDRTASARRARRVAA